MFNFKVFEDYIETYLTGKQLMTMAQLNKGTAFSAEERQTFGLLGKLPARIETLEEQAARAYLQFSRYQTDMQKHIYLNSLHDRNQVLFYQLVTTHLEEMVPLIYTPCIGTAVKEFSHEFRQARGLFIDYEDRHQLDAVLDNRSNSDIEVIVVTDGEGVLGIGDQGVGSINIPIAKLMVYTLFAGIHPLKTLPIYLDVGTNNPTHLEDPLYLGRRHPRLAPQEYDEFIAQFVAAIQRKFPHAFLHWEDFGRENALRILTQYQNQCCSFNDDIQGTGAVTLAAILAAVKKNQQLLTEQRIVIFGAGTAGAGIADQLFDALYREGLNSHEARKRIWLVDRPGLLLNHYAQLTPGQRTYAREANEVNCWQLNAEGKITLEETIDRVKPTVLIGCSSQTNAFHEALVKKMAAEVENPIIFSLSNPTERAEATPAHLIEWTQGKGHIATGSPFPPVIYKGKSYLISQCNNALIYPGIGLGIIATQAKQLTKPMIWAACKALSDFAQHHDSLLPSFLQARAAAKVIATAVATQAMKDNIANKHIVGDIDNYIQQLMWEPKYSPLKFKQNNITRK